MTRRAQKKTNVDRNKLYVEVRKLSDESRLGLLDRAIDLLPKSRLADLVDGYLEPERLRPDGASTRRLVASVKVFHDASLRGEFYESFRVNSRNFMDKSSGTQAWIAECHRLLDRCVAASGKGRHAEAREAFELIFSLLRRVNEEDQEVVFFAGVAIPCLPPVPGAPPLGTPRGRCAHAAHAAVDCSPALLRWHVAGGPQRPRERGPRWRFSGGEEIGLFRVVALECAERFPENEPVILRLSRVKQPGVEP